MPHPTRTLRLIHPGDLGFLLEARDELAALAVCAYSHDVDPDIAIRGQLAIEDLLTRAAPDRAPTWTGQWVAQDATWHHDPTDPADRLASCPLCTPPVQTAHAA